MTELQPAHFTQGACHTARGDRLVFSSLVCSEGVADSGDLLVSDGGGLDVSVASGSAFIDGTSIADQGMYHVANIGATILTVTAADLVNPRVDTVVARVYDAEYAGVANDWALEIVKGAASPAPVPAALPANSIALAYIAVAAGAVSLTSANITDERVEYEFCHDLSSQVDALQEDVDAIGIWQSYEPTDNIAVATATGEFCEVGGIVFVEFKVTFTNDTSAAGRFTIGLPSNAAAPVPTAIGNASLLDSSTGVPDSAVCVLNSASTIAFLVGQNRLDHNTPWTWNAGDTITGTLAYRKA